MSVRVKPVRTLGATLGQFITPPNHHRKGREDHYLEVKAVSMSGRSMHHGNRVMSICVKDGVTRFVKDW